MTDDDALFTGDPGRCPTCGASWEWVRPGKSQPVCTCWATCNVHGPNAVRYHPEGEVARASGWFCAECWRGVGRETRSRNENAPPT